jgi:hypothetical protein
VKPSIPAETIKTSRERTRTRKRDLRLNAVHDLHSTSVASHKYDTYDTHVSSSSYASMLCMTCMGQGYSLRISGENQQK